MKRKHWLIGGGIGLTAITIILIMANKDKVKDAWTNLLGRKDLPRGLRNNNPGNLILTNINWVGKIPNAQNTDGKFEQFKALPYGFRAKALDIRGDIQKKGLDTIDKLITVYAPPFENNTESYIVNTAKRTGIARNAKLTGSKDELKKLMLSMMVSENGTIANNYAKDIDIALTMIS